MLKNTIKYYLRASYRRKLLDRLQETYKDIYTGTVLDIGGRSRGRFIKPKNQVDKWIFVDIESSHDPELVLDVSDMACIRNNSIDIVNTIEVFEHVENISEAILECHRVLKPGGKLIISVPFMYPYHADPNDFQRWTITKWKKSLTSSGFSIQHLIIMGRYFTVLADELRVLVNTIHVRLRLFRYLVYPFLDFLVALDKIKAIRNHSRLRMYHGGYYIIVRKDEV